jgi:hypothetical protein
MIIATIFFGIVSELLREAKTVKGEHWVFQSDVWSSVYLAFQMGMSYTLMLIVMLFDFWVVFSACIGLGLGHFAGRKWRKSVMSVMRKTTPETYEDGSGLLGGPTGPNYQTASPVYESASPGSVNGEFSKSDLTAPLLSPLMDGGTPCCRV